MTQPPTFTPKDDPVIRLKEKGGHVRPVEEGYGQWVARIGSKVATGKDAPAAARNLLEKLR